MDSNNDRESGAERDTFRFSDMEIEKDNVLVDYITCSEKNRRTRRHFSVIEVLEDDDSGSRSKRSRASNFFRRLNQHGKGNRKSMEFEVIESEAKLKSTPSKHSHLNRENGIWGSQSWSVDSKNLHPEVAELLEAACHGHADKIKEILEEQNSSRNSSKLNIKLQVDILGRTALHLAVYNNHFETANLLIDQGVPVDIWDREKKATPLICAAAIGQVPLVELLLNNGANVNNGYERGNTALLWAAKSRNFECLRKILENGALQNSPVMYCETPLHVAASNGDYEILKLLLENGADVLLRTGDGRNTALHLAAQECHTSCCTLLLDYNASIDVQNAKGETALHISALKDFETLQILLEHGASVRLKDFDGRTALFYAIEKTSKNIDAGQCVSLLIKYQADVNCQDNIGLCPLHIAAIKEAKECASILIENNANVALESKAGTSVLSLMLRKIPDTMRFIKKHLNKSVIVIRDTNDSSCKVKLDFKSIVPNCCYRPNQSTNQRKKGKVYDFDKDDPITFRKESELIKSLIINGQKDILLHPLVEAFLTLKWKKVRKFFYAGFLLKVILVILFSFFMVYLYAICIVVDKDESQNQTTVGNETITYPSYSPSPFCFKTSEWVTIWTLIVCLAVILMAQELAQLFQSFKAYITYIESWIFWIFMISLCVTCEFLPRDGLHFIRKDWQQAFAAVSVFLAWIFVLLQLGKFPASGTLVQMFFKVFYNFVQFFGAYFCFIMAFSLAFYILNPAIDQTFKNVLLSFSKTIRMMAGDLNDDDLFKTKFIWVVHILYTIFVIMIVIVLMNLLVGLAVADIQGMYRDARLLRLSRQTALICHLESSFLSPFILKCMPKSFALAIKKNILILPQLRNGCYYFKPYDHRDVELPSYLKLATLKMANTSLTELNDLNNDGHSTNTERSVLKDVWLKIDVLLKQSDEIQKQSDGMQKQLDTIIAKLDSLSAKVH